MAENIESKLAKIPDYIIKSFDRDYQKCLDEKRPKVAEMLIIALGARYSQCGLFNDGVKAKLLQERERRNAK